VSGFAVSALGQTQVKVEVNGTEVYFQDSKPFIDDNNRIMVPVRFVAEWMRADVEWIEESRTVSIALNDNTIIFFIDSDKMTVNKQTKKMDTTAIIKNGRTYIPVRFCAEALESEVSWNEEKKTAYIKTNFDFEKKEIKDSGFSGDPPTYSKNDLVYRSNIIIRGVVDGILPSKLYSGALYTDCSIKILDVYKGEVEDEKVLVRLARGYDENEIYIKDALEPDFLYGEEVILFLSKGNNTESPDEKYYRLVGSVQGKYIRSDNSSDEFISKLNLAKWTITLNNFRDEVKYELEKAKFRPTREEIRQNNEKVIGQQGYSRTELINLADVIVRGTVKGKLPSKWSINGDKKLQTDISIEISEIFKGGPYDNNILVRVDEGQDSSTVIDIKQYPDFKDGEEVILFLSKDVSEQANLNENYYILTGMAQGKYFLSEGEFTCADEILNNPKIIVNDFKDEIKDALEKIDLYPNIRDKNSPY
jgi:hypothetical protein